MGCQFSYTASELKRPAGIIGSRAAWLKGNVKERAWHGSSQQTAALTWAQAGRSLQVPDAKVPPLTYLPRTRGLTSISQARGGVCLAKHLVGRSSSPGGRVPIEGRGFTPPFCPCQKLWCPVSCALDGLLHFRLPLTRSWRHKHQTGRPGIQKGQRPPFFPTRKKSC